MLREWGFDRLISSAKILSRPNSYIYDQSSRPSSICSSCFMWIQTRRRSTSFWLPEPRGLRRGFAETGFISEDHGRLAAAVGGAGGAGEVTGEVSWHKAQTGPSSFSWHTVSGCSPGPRGQGYGTRAPRLLAEYLFAHTPVTGPR
jgi:hypothetical protein